MASSVRAFQYPIQVRQKVQSPSKISSGRSFVGTVGFTRSWEFYRIVRGDHEGSYREETAGRPPESGKSGPPKNYIARRTVMRSAIELNAALSCPGSGASAK